MRHLLGAAAVACAALSAVVDARLLRWEADPNEGHWLPARETMAVQALLGGGDVSPMPTAAPLLPPREVLDKRSGTNNTCAFVSGSADIPLYCATSSGCVFHSQRKAFGCCPDRASKSNQFCEAWTTCLHSSEGTRLDVSNTGGETMWCGNSMYPSCVKHTFAESTLQGYSLWGCGKIATTDFVLRSATDGTSTTGTGGGGGTRATGSSRSTNVIQGVGGTDGDQGATSTPGSGSGSGGSGQTQDSGPPLGAIIGGAVGGFAALAILGFAIFFLVRRSRRTGAAHPVHGQQNGVPGAGGGGPAPPGGGPAAPVMPGSPGHPQQQQQGYPSPQMAEQQQQQQQQQQQHGQYGFAPVTDPRASMAKPPYSVTNSVYDPAGMSPPHSPSPGYSPNGVNPTPSPPPPSQSPPIGQAPQPFGAAWAMPPQQQQGPPGYQQNQHQQQYPQQTPPQQYNAMPPPPPAAYQQHPQQFQQSHQGYAELPTGRGDRELRELA